MGSSFLFISQSIGRKHLHGSANWNQCAYQRNDEQGKVSDEADHGELYTRW